MRAPAQLARMKAFYSSRLLLLVKCEIVLWLLELVKAFRSIGAWVKFPSSPDRQALMSVGRANPEEDTLQYPPSKIPHLRMIISNLNLSLFRVANEPESGITYFLRKMRLLPKSLQSLPSNWNQTMSKRFIDQNSGSFDWLTWVLSANRRFLFSLSIEVLGI